MYQEELTYKIRGAVYEVYRNLGHGFLEAVYQNALRHELKQCGLQVKSEVPLTVSYKGRTVGEYRADMIVEQSVLLELKAQSNLPPYAQAQVLNYLRATDMKIG